MFAPSLTSTSPLGCSYGRTLKGPTGKHINLNCFTGRILGCGGKANTVAFVATTETNKETRTVRDFNLTEPLCLKSPNRFTFGNQKTCSTRGESKHGHNGQNKPENNCNLPKQ